MFWRCGTSIPVPLACKASALPFELHPSALKALSVLVNNIHWVLFFNLPQLTSKHNSRSLRKMLWRCGSSIHVPLACKASALPHELHPRTLHALSYLVNKGAWILVFDRHNLQRKIRFEDLGVFWRCGTSIPVPLACKASALPFELHHRIIFTSS